MTERRILSAIVVKSDRRPDTDGLITTEICVFISP
jgi:hypothetical protein